MWIKQLCNNNVLDFATALLVFFAAGFREHCVTSLETASKEITVLWVQKHFGIFEKRAPGQLTGMITYGDDQINGFFGSSNRLL